MKTKKLIAILAACAATSASAATRTYCFELLFKDDRWDCPTPSEAGAKRGCQQTYYNFSSQPDGYYAHPVGALVELWDKDDTSDDEYIGTWYLTSETGGCATFEWENSTYDNGEADPDVYPIWKSEVRSTADASPHVVATDMALNPYGGVTWRAFAYSNCTNGANCDQAGYLLITTDSTTERGGRAMSLDSAQHMLQTYATIMDNEDINMKWPSTQSQALDRYTFEVDETRGDQPQSPCHELGHLLQMQEFVRDGLQDDCSLNGAGHSLTGSEHESCATAEGWAGYVAIASLWDPQNNSSAPSRWGIDYVTATPLEAVCTDNKGIEAQVTKAFWDLDDDENEVGVAPSTIDDEKDSDTLDIAERWGVFPTGTGNRDDWESDPDGVNLWDYHINSQSWWASLDATRHTIMGHNCMGTQDTN
jgi:hypothetical protein